jgi:hypothetical protein
MTFYFTVARHWTQALFPLMFTAVL